MSSRERSSAPEPNAGPLEEPSCGICGSTEAVTLFERSSDLHAEESFVPSTDAFQQYGRIVKCAKCGVARLSPRQPWSFLRQVYAESEDPLYLAEYSGRRASAAGIAKFLAKYMPSGSLLDVGCGVGVFLSVAAERWKVSGVELCSWAVRKARDSFSLTVHEGTIEDAGLLDSSLDAVTMLDVIEHLPNPLEVVAEIKRVLRPGGVLFVLTPDIGSVVARLMGSWWWGLRPAHLYYFTRKDIVALLENSGFEVKVVKYWGRRFTLGYWISRMRGYTPGLVGIASAIARVTRIERIPLTIDTFDSIGVVAVKKS